MTVTIDLFPEEERRLQERAARHGQDLTAYLRRIIREDLDAPTSGGEGTFAEVFAPIHEDFRKGGMTESELDALLEEAIDESRAGRRRGKTGSR